ncbi:cysteine--tRNA ligase [Candidatus Acetothermia bacterium]|nr:cysteine--tRNA ligase [Candidatus Acetothermia bacterium]MBI3642787.1 cysteine--tRNA ligase [Candidatus Acetothermia bacterium]
MKFYNTLTKKLEDFQPVEPGRVKMYVCGPTVYDYFHIGNARPFILFDSLRRYLEHRGYKVLYAQNVTDVDDKIINRATAEKISPSEVAQKYTQAYFEDLEKLGVRPANIQPKATEKIPEMVKFIEQLIQKGSAYEVKGDIFFRVKRFKGYGKLSKKSIDDLQAGARVEVNEQKEDPLDFALWKGAKPGEPHWPSPWGEGRPGWHLECSVMSMEILGETFDIHGGGTDLIFPHHENEIAQSESNTGKPFVRYWLHNELLNIQGEKMSKSLGNFEYARDIIAQYGREAIRYFYLSKHYRSPMGFSHDLLADSKRAVERIYNLLEGLASQVKGQADDLKLDPKKLSDAGKDFLALIEKTREEYIQSLDNDFNTAGGMGVLFEFVKEANIFRQNVAPSDLPLLKEALDLFRELGEPLGLFQESPWMQSGSESQEKLIQLLIQLRNDLRVKKEFQLSDKIRNQLQEMGIELKDKDNETLWSYVRK